MEQDKSSCVLRQKKCSVAPFTLLYLTLIFTLILKGGVLIPHIAKSTTREAHFFSISQYQRMEIAFFEAYKNLKTI